MIYFVGAGPGAIDLITVRGRRLLEQADVIIYAGSLVNKELLACAGEQCESYNSATMCLEEILSVMVQAERAGKRVVRLHTGDPSLYGAIREQMDRLAGEGISYEVCPGVSSFCGAAASLKAEYTLPGVSQSVIITRMEGRTPMPEAERLRLLAGHGCTMVLFLSAGLLEQVREELLQGAYEPDTPCAIVYKATWPEERIVRGTLEELPGLAKKHQITKTALIVVGAVLDSDYELSKLYDRSFGTEFRKAVPEEVKRTGVAVISFTDRGGERSKELLGELRKQGISCEGFTPKKREADGLISFDGLNGLTERLFCERELLLFIGAAGIAVRAIAPFLRGKQTDPAVLVMDEAGGHVISLLSGHLGGANDWCRRIAAISGAEPVITTATDVNGSFAVDSFARENGLLIRDLAACKEISARLLAGESVAVLSDYSIEGELPEGLKTVTESEASLFPCGIWIHRETGAEPGTKPFDTTCELLVRNLYLGVGCRKGKTGRELEEFLSECLQRHGLSAGRLSAVASVTDKAEEEGLCELSEKWRLPFLTYRPEELEQATGSFSESDFVRQTVGVGNVCERAAALASGGGSPVMAKQCGAGMTAAVAEQERMLYWKQP